MFSKQFAKDALERAVKTFCQALLALFTVGVSITNIDWEQALAVAATAALVSVLTSIGSIGFGSQDTASTIRTPQDNLNV